MNIIPILAKYLLCKIYSEIMEEKIQKKKTDSVSFRYNILIHLFKVEISNTLQHILQKYVSK